MCPLSAQPSIGTLPFLPTAQPPSGCGVKRIFAWIIKNRRFVRDYEHLTAVAETLIVIAASATLLRRGP